MEVFLQFILEDLVKIAHERWGWGAGLLAFFLGLIVLVPLGILLVIWIG
jgi:hypothetical protein